MSSSAGNGCGCPLRWIITSLCFYACGIVFMQRTNMSVAIVAMVAVNSGGGGSGHNQSINSKLSTECYPNGSDTSSGGPTTSRPMERSWWSSQASTRFSQDDGATIQFDWSEELQVGSSLDLGKGKSINQKN